MKTLLTVAVLLAASHAMAEDPAPAAAPGANKKAEVQALNADIKDNREKIYLNRKENLASRAKQLDEVHDLATQERAAIDAVKADASKTPADKKAAIRAIREDYKARKDAVRAKLRADRETARAAIMAERDKIHQDQQERAQIKNSK